MTSNQSGFLLAQLIIGMGLMGIVMMGFASMLVIQAKESAALEQKLGAMDLERLLITTLSDTSLCAYQLTNPKRTFDASLINSKNKPTITLADKKGEGLSSSPFPGAPKIAIVGEPASALSNALVVKSIRLSDIAGDATGNTFSANFQISFDEKKLARQLKPLTVKTLLQTTGAGSLKTITGCGGSGTQGPMSLYGARNRCKNDKFGFICARTGSLTNDMCASTEWLVLNPAHPMVWDGQGYSTPTWSGTKWDVFCLNGFQ